MLENTQRPGCEPLSTRTLANRLVRLNVEREKSAAVRERRKSTDLKATHVTRYRQTEHRGKEPPPPRGLCKRHQVSPMLVRVWAVKGAYMGGTCMRLRTTGGGERGEVSSDMPKEHAVTRTVTRYLRVVNHRATVSHERLN